MRNKEQRLTQLLEKYRNNNLSPAEYEEFLQLMDQPGAESVIDGVAESDWAQSGKILQLIQADGGTGRRKVARIIPFSMAIAASVALITALYFYWPMLSPSAKPLAYHTGYGETRKFILPDSSTVLLNANSRLVWDGAWKRNAKRVVKLEGEAFFEVKKAQGMEFVVESGGVKVRVLGTVFNVRNRRGLTDVFLESGKVNLEIGEPGVRTLAMKPGNSVHYDIHKKDLAVEETSTLTHSASWVEGMLEFQNESLGEILNHFEELYGKKFEIENKDLLTKRMDLSLPYSNWDLIRKALEISLHVEFTEHNDVIVVR